MKVLCSAWRCLSAPLAALVASAALAAPAAMLNLPDFDALAAKATETVSISLDASLLGLAASFLDPGNPDDAATRELIAGLKGIYVRSYTFGQDFAYPAAQVDLVRKQLAASAWQRLVEVNSTRDHTHVQIYVSVDRGVANGLAIIASEPREFTIVNIVGSIDLAKLRRLEGKFGIPKLDLPDGK
jgi:nucleotidyltransferase/DNA polymerase involved in DNA repair